MDINKGDEEHPNYRSRLVAKEYRVDVRPELYTATPVSECLRLMISRLASARNLKLMYADVSGAYFYAKAIRPVYVKLPEGGPRGWRRESLRQVGHVHVWN